jgi:catechol 2,3-dioxygenase-like lactoylglutathione lyase family enzyme
MKRVFAALISTLVLGACASAGETLRAPAAAESAAQNPLDLRRTTLVVRDIENSLALYRDALGMTIEYDQTLTSPGLSSRADGDGVNRSRLVLLKANNSYIGMLGLWQFLDQTDHDRKPADAADFTPGDIVLLFNTNDLDRAFVAAAAVANVKVVGEPHLRKYPSPAGDIEVMVSMLVDPDGHTVELNRLIRDPRRP